MISYISQNAFFNFQGAEEKVHEPVVQILIKSECKRNKAITN